MPFCRATKFFLFLVLWANVGSSQNLPVKNYTAANELPNNTVRSLLVDSNSILWVGTDNGVVRRENDVFQYFFEEDGLAMNSCWAIAEDSAQNIWFGSYGGGVSMYDGFGFKVISEEDGLVHNEITQLFSYGDHMYVGTSDGISIIDINSFEVQSPKLPPGEQLFRVDGFFEYQQEIYAVTYRTGIYKIMTRKKEAALVKVNDHTYIYSAFVDGDSIFSSNKGYFTKNALSDYVKQEGPLSPKKLGESIIWDYVKTNDGKIFAAAWGIYDTNGGIYEVVDNRLVSRASEFDVPSREVVSLAYDPGFERLYAGSRDAGLFEIALNPQIKFHSVEGKDILGFAGTENTSAVLLNDGILINRAEKELKIPLSRLKEWQESYVRITSRPLPRHRDDFYELDHTTPEEEIIFYDLKAFRETYWVNTNIGIFAIKPSGKLAHYLPLHSEEINFTPEGNLIETNPYGGVRVYSEPGALQYEHFGQADPHTPTMVVGSLRKEDKTYLLSVFSGLYVWENNGFRSYTTDGTWKEKKLRHITDFGNDLAISTEFGDVYIVTDDAAFKVLKKIPRAKIRGNSIGFLKEDAGTLIIGTEKGITLYKEDRFLFLDKEQGLQQPLLGATVNNKLLTVGSRNGYYSIDLDAVRDTQPLIREISPKEVYVNNRKVSPEQKDRLRLAHDENTVRLRFSTNAHPYPNKLKYQYRLNAGEEWSPPASSPEIFLPSLPPKDYEVDVRVADESTGMSYTQSLLTLSIFPPFWNTWWFALLAAGLFLTVVLGIYKFQIMQTRKFEGQKGLIRKRFEETKMEALLAQMNPHFIFNAMNSIQYYIMDNDIDNATTFLGDFARLIRLNLDHCTKPTILLTEEIEYLQSYIRVENTRFNNAIQVKFDIDPNIDVYEVEIPTMLLQTFVENVFVHAFPTSFINPVLKISFKLLPEGILQCRIEDNGIGISRTPGKLHESKGVALVRERLALLGYKVEEALQITSEKDKGTVVVLHLNV